MHTYSRAGRAIAVLLVVLLAASAGFWAYRVGYAHGVSEGIAMNLAAAGPEAAKAAPNVGPNTPVAPYGPYPYAHPYGWHGHYGWGWGFFPFGFFGPLLVLAFWFFIVRMLLWGGRGRWGRGGPGGGRWGRGGPWRGGPWGRRGWYDGHRYDDVDAPSRHARL